jgi:hypothetical protein
MEHMGPEEASDESACLIGAEGTEAVGEARRSGQAQMRDLDEQLDAALACTFPCSDPVGCLAACDSDCPSD